MRNRLLHAHSPLAASRTSAALAVLVAILASLALNADAQTPQPLPPRPGTPAVEPAALLAKIRSRYTSAPSFSMSFVQVYAPAGFGDTAPESGTLVLQAPESVRFEYQGAEGKLFTFDGKAARQYVAKDRQLVLKSLGPGDRERLPIVFLEAPEKLLARYAAEASGAAGGLVELTLTPRAAAEPKRLTLAATPAGEIRRLVILDGGGNRTTFTFADVAAGPRRPEADFALVPPKGTKIIAD